MDLAREVEHLRSENVALRSLLCGLCVGLSQMSEVHREIIAQAFDFADRFATDRPEPVATAPDPRDHRDLIRQLRSSVVGRYSDLPRY